MSREEVLETIIEIGKDIFDNDDLMLTETSVANEVDGWDSLAHLSLMNELEGEYGIKFELSEIQGLKSVADLITTILRYVG